MRDLLSTSVSGELDIVAHTTDVTKEADIDALLEKTIRDLGRVDYAANCAVGSGTLHAAKDTDICSGCSPKATAFA